MITYLLPLIYTTLTATTVTIRNAVADGSRPIALNGEVIGYVETRIFAAAIYYEGGGTLRQEAYDWAFTYTGLDGVETWGNADSLREAKDKLNSRLGLVGSA